MHRYTDPERETRLVMHTKYYNNVTVNNIYILSMHVACINTIVQATILILREGPYWLNILLLRQDIVI